MALPVLAGVLGMLDELSLEAAHAERARRHAKAGECPIEDHRRLQAPEAEPEIVVHGKVESLVQQAHPVEGAPTDERRGAADEVLHEVERVAVVPEEEALV